MNPVIKTKWLAALRSGDYKQARGTLRCDDSYCCLGVLTDLFIKENPDAKWVERQMGESYKGECHIKYDLSVPDEKITSGILSEYVCEWAGLNTDGNPIVDDNENGRNIRSSLSTMNDNGKDFNHIANVIENEKEL